MQQLTATPTGYLEPGLVKLMINENVDGPPEMTLEVDQATILLIEVQEGNETKWCLFPREHCIMGGRALH
jgi:hypothetical protein